MPGIDPVLTLSILAEAVDMRRFGHVRQFLKCCGSICVPNNRKGSWHDAPVEAGNARTLRLLDGATIRDIHATDTFRRKFDGHMRVGQQNADRKRKAYTAYAARMARVAYMFVKTGHDYRASRKRRD